jgi:hypothetical protein
VNRRVVEVVAVRAGTGDFEHAAESGRLHGRRVQVTVRGP